MQHPITRPTAISVRAAVEDFLLVCRLAKRSQHTLRQYQGNLNRFCWWLERIPITRLDAISPTTIRQFLVYLADGANDSQGKERWGKPFVPIQAISERAYYVTIRRFFSWCAAEDLISETPIDRRRIPPPTPARRRVTAFEKAHILALLDAAKQGRSPSRDRAILLLLLDTGMRASELASIDVRNCDLRPDSSRIKIIGKGNKERIVILGARALKALRDYVRSKEREPYPFDGRLFRSTGGRPLTYWGIREIFERLRERARIHGFRASAHTMRHTSAIEALRNGMDLASVQQLLGHEDISTTRLYLNLVEDDLRNAHRKASPADHLFDRTP